MKNKMFMTLFIDYLIMLTGFYLVISVFYGYITQQINLTSQFAGIVLGIFSFAAMLMRPLSGLLSERINHSLLLRVSVGSMILAEIIYWLAATPSLLLAARIINGAGFALASTIMVVEVYKSIPVSKAGSAIGAFGLTNVIAASVGPLLGTKLLLHFGYPAVFISSIGLYALMFICIPKTEEVEAEAKRPLTLQSFFAPKVVFYACIGGVFSFVSAILSSYIVSFGNALGGLDLSLFFSFNAIAVFVIRLIGGKIYDKKGIFVAGPPTMIFMAIALFLVGYSQVINPGNPSPIIFISAVILAIGQGVAWPALQTISLQTMDKSQSGAASGTYSLGADIGQMLGPVFAGYVLGKYIGETGYFYLFRYSGAIVIIATLIFTMYLCIKFKKENRV